MKSASMRLILKIREIQEYFFKNDFNSLRLVVICTFLFGLLAFGQAVFGKFNYHDECFGYDNILLYVPLEHGCWMQYILALIVFKLFGSASSLPIISVFFSLFFLSLAIFLLQKLFEIKKKSLKILLCLIMVSSPVIAVLYGYMYIAPYFMFSLFLSVLSCYVLCKKNKWYTFVIAVVLQAMAVGIYQAYIPFSISMLLVYFIVQVHESTRVNKKVFYFIKIALKYLGFCLSFIVLYFLIIKLYVSVLNVHLSDYKGINNMGQESPLVYLFRVFEAYYYFIYPRLFFDHGFLPSNLFYFYYVIIFILFLLSIFIIIKSFKKSVSQGLFVLLAILLFPLAINFIIVMVPKSIIYALMQYGSIWIFISIIIFFSIIDINSKTIKKALFILLCLSFAFVGANNIGFDNKCFLKAGLIQQRLVANYTTLITRIKSVKGYNEKMCVSFVNIEHFSDLTLKDTESFVINNSIFGSSTSMFFLESYNYQEQIAVLTGFSPEYKDPNVYIGNKEVMKMPAYPDDGSIKVIDNTVIVKF